MTALKAFSLKKKQKNKHAEFLNYDLEAIW